MNIALASLLPKLRPRRNVREGYPYRPLLGAGVFIGAEEWQARWPGKQEIQWRQAQTLNQKRQPHRMACRIVRIRIARIAKS